VSFANLKRVMNFDLKLNISDEEIADMIEQCKITSAPEGSVGMPGNYAAIEESESNYVPDTD
jgi:hypothetical protein